MTLFLLKYKIFYDLNVYENQKSSIDHKKKMFLTSRTIIYY